MHDDSLGDDDVPLRGCCGCVLGDSVGGDEVERVNCDRCSFYANRELIPIEVDYLKRNSNTIIDHRICTLGGCDGSMFIDKERGEEDE